MKNRLPHHEVGLSVAAAVGVGLYVILDVVAQLQPPHYSVLHQPESDLGVGPYSAIMNTNFIVRGLTALTLAALLIGQPMRRSQRAGVMLIAMWGLCSALLSVFHTDITTGPLVSNTTTIRGNVHLALALGGFLAASVGIVILGTNVFNRYQHTWPLVYAPTVMSVAFATAAVTTDLFGLFERLFVAAILLWTAAVAADRLRTWLVPLNGPRAKRQSRTADHTGFSSTAGQPAPRPRSPC